MLQRTHYEISHLPDVYGMPSLEPLKVAFALNFEGPHHIGTGRAEGLLNRTVRRDARGRPYVPGSALKGALRIEAERLANRLDAELRRG